MKRNGRKAWLAVAALAAAVPAPALLAQGGTETQVQSGPAQTALAAKLRLVKLLLDQSPAVQRIPASGNATAKKKLADAQAMYAQARAAADAGGGADAIKLLDDALRQIVAASYLVPDAAQQVAQERARYAGLAEAVRTFQQLYRNVAARMSAKKAQVPQLDAAKINADIERAASLASAGKHAEANGLLNGAYKTIVGTINRMLSAETIVYDQKFESPAEEFRFELARNRSFEDLVPVAIAELNTPRDSAALAERYVQQSRELRQKAEQQSASGDYATAIKLLQEASGHLQRSLRVAGVVVPQAQDNSQGTPP